jgi:hypothetical protein
MGVAVAALQWRPRDFWQATPMEFWDSINAYERLNRLLDEE